MQSLSVVIVCKNEADIISKSLQSLHGLSDDIVVYDNGSSDNTTEIAQSLHANVYHGKWKGFGATKRDANKCARYDWILSLDADECLDEALKSELLNLQLNDPAIVYNLKFKNFFGKKYLKYGEWGSDDHVRLFNRTIINWNDAAVHESLIIPEHVKERTLKGHVLHYTVKNLTEYTRKMVEYAMLNGQHYFMQGKRPNIIKLYLSPAFNFFNYYIIHLGFLDGFEGYLSAKITAQYTFLKYARLRELWKEAKENRSVS